MKRTTAFFRALSLLLCLLTLVGLFAACKSLSKPPEGTLAPPVEDDVTTATKAPSTTEAATAANTPEVRGTGAVSFNLTVTDLDGTKKEFVVKTDKENVADALVEVGLISGQNSEYGLYIKVVNGITADYDVDKTYWSVLVNGEYSMVGASSVPVTEGLQVELKKTK